MGEQAFDSMKTQQSVSNKVVANQYVQCIANAITQHVPNSVFAGEWELVVFDEPQVNAFALPGGKIGVYTGLMGVATTQAQLAAVIGHEVGHVIAEHGNERMSSSALINVGLEVTNQLLKTNQIASSSLLMAGLGLGVQVGVQLPFSRTHESEADLIGLELMARAGFDPRESVTLWENMAKASGDNRQAELLSTHPLPATRISNLSKNMDNAMLFYIAATTKPKCG
ncbi:M48 family metallopeptidase [Paraglaciecola sp. 2405UD69-4]|uniref:M48 family metallopeptidase n=1 Tax=Paraglaciecola sp. 2405UD69-4 TaxID=3391836 RepID=UPI0039C9B449